MAESGALAILSYTKFLVVKGNLDTKIVNSNQALIKVKESEEKNSEYVNKRLIVRTQQEEKKDNETDAWIRNTSTGCHEKDKKLELIR